MGKLICCVGATRSGKSTYCKEWVMEKPGRVIVCADKIRLSLTGDRFNSFSEPFISAIKQVMIRTLLHDFDVIIDGTHTSIGSLKQVLQIDKNAEFLIFDTPPEVCKQRAKDTGQEDLYPVIDRMWKQLIHLKTVNNGFQNAIELLREEVMENKIV